MSGKALVWLTATLRMMGLPHLLHSIAKEIFGGIK